MSEALSKGREWLVIIALLSLNIVEQSASVINATIPGMAKTFSNESLVHVELVTTIVSVFVTVFVLLSGAVVKQIGQKKTAILGLAIAAVASVIPAISNSFMVVIISRAILGIGIGLANPLAISMIGVFFYGDQRARLMGWRSAIAGIGTAIMTYVAGKLLVFGWHAAYWSYLLFIPTLLLFIFFVPDPEKTGAVARQEAEQAKEKAAAAKQGRTIKQDSVGLIIVYTILIFLLLIFTMVFAVKLPTFFVQSHIGTATQASTTWSIVNIATVIGGFIFGPAYKLMRQYVLPLSVILGGICIFLIGKANSVLTIQIIAAISGIASSLAIPYIFTRVSESTSPSRAPFFTSVVLVGSNLGSFLSPYGGKLLGATAQQAVTNAGLSEVILAIILFIAIIIMKRSGAKAQL